MKIVINGAGVAGPALAYWLRRSDLAAAIYEALDDQVETIACVLPR